MIKVHISATVSSTLASSLSLRFRAQAGSDDAPSLLRCLVLLGAVQEDLTTRGCFITLVLRISGTICETVFQKYLYITAERDVDWKSHICPSGSTGADQRTSV